MIDRKKLLKENGFMPWRWGNENKMEGYLDEELCKKLIGVSEKCYVAVLLDEDEARFITKKNFEEKVSENKNQIQIERIIFGNEKSKLYRDGKLILLEKIIPLDNLINQLRVLID